MRCTFPAGIATWSSSANSGHVAIAARILRRHAPFVAKEDMHARPVDRGRGQTLIDGLWRIASRQRDSEGTARGDRLGRGGSDEIHSAGDQCGLVGEDGRLGDGAVRGSNDESLWHL